MRGIGLRLCDELIRRGFSFRHSVDCQIEIGVGLANPQVGRELRAPLQFVHLCSALEMVPHANILLERVERAGIMLNRPIQQFLCLRLFGERLQLLQINVRERRVGACRGEI